MKMLYKEKDLEKKTLTEIGTLILGQEQKIKEFAAKIGTGKAKPADMMAFNSDLALLKKVLDKKMHEQTNSIPRVQPKAAKQMKSYEDYLKSKNHEK
jgi:predicted ATP-dependent Lon-type protease